MINISFWGSPVIAADLLKALLNDSRFKIAFVVTQPDKARSRRGRQVQPSPVKKVALENELPVFSPVKIKKETPALLEKWREYSVDFHVILAYGKLIPEPLFNYPPLQALNFHASLLPKLRGAAPIEYALLEGFKESGFSLQRIARELDAGDVYFDHKIPIEWKETRDSLYAKISNAILTQGIEALVQYSQGELKARAQNHAEATFCSKIDTTLGRVDFSQTALQIRRKAQALSERPGIYAVYKNKKIKLFLDFNMGIDDINSAPLTSQGEILQVSDMLMVGCGQKSWLPVKEIQLEGKKRMGIPDFVNGYQVKKGEFFE